jgi:hypothetical protein
MGQGVPQVRFGVEAVERGGADQCIERGGAFAATSDLRERLDSDCSNQLRIESSSGRARA